jgi:hypothetical protein
LVVEAKDSRVVGGVNADDKSLVSGEVYSPEQFLEVARPQFGRSTRGFGPASQADLVFFFLAHLRPLNLIALDGSWFHHIATAS